MSHNIKEIKLVNYTLPNMSSSYKEQRVYTILLGNGIKRSFTSKNYLTYYLNRVNADLNNCLTEATELLGLTYMEYYKTWKYLNRKTIQRKLFDAEDYLNKAVTKCQLPNGNHFTFKHMYYAIDNIIDVLTTIIKYKKKMNQYMSVNSMELTLNRIENLKTKLDNIGIETKKPPNGGS